MTADDKNHDDVSKISRKNSSNVIDYSNYHSNMYRESTFMEVKAQFLVNGQTDDQLTFLDEDSGRVHISNFGGCVGRQYDTEINYIVIGR